MKMEVENGSVLGLFRSPDTSEIYRQNKAKLLENETPREETGNRGNNWPPRPWGPPRPGRGIHHGPWCPSRPARGSHWLWWLLGCPNAAFWGHLVLRLGPRVLPFFGSFEPPCKLLLILMAHTSLAWIHLKHFSPNLGLNHRNLQ